MPKISDVAILLQPKQPILSIRTRTTSHDLSMLIGASCKRLLAYLDELHTHMTDVFFVAYHNLDVVNLDVEIGVSVAREFPGSASIQAGHLPEGLVAFSFYQGPYQDIAPFYDDMQEWIGQNGYARKGAYYEYYYNGPPYHERHWLTKVLFPIQKHP